MSFLRTLHWLSLFEGVSTLVLSMRTIAMVIVIAASLRSAATHAQERSPLPDPAAVVVPDLSGSDRSEVIKDGWKYFFFWKDGVRFEEAHADLADCRRFLHRNSWQDVHLKRFVPWDSRPGRRRVAATGNYGLVGAVIAGIVEGSLQHRDYQANMRSCMEPRGYTRYGVAARIWKNVTSLPQDQSIAVQAKIASGPAFGKVPHQ